MAIKEWLLLPFLGSSRAPRHARRQSAGDDGRVTLGKDNFPKNESAAEFAKKSEDEIVNDGAAPITWWVISTLFPLIAGTFGPIANAFNICAIAIDWRLIVDADNNESQGQHITDPRWLVAVNAVSLSIAIIANIALLAHMTKRARFNVAAPVVIVGWYVAGFIDVALVAAVPSHVPLPANAMATWSQAYYYAIFSGAIYVILALMLSVTAYGVWFRQLSESFKLTLAQRSLMIQTIMLMGYILAAGEVYSTIEGWVFLDGVYMVVITVFTIGFGDFTPHTHLGRSLFFPMAVGGIIFVGMIIANIRTLVLESASVKVSTRLVEKARYNAIAAGSPADGILKIRGVRRRSTDAPTELERREKEFNAMREIQAAAALNNRLFSLVSATTAFMVLWFVGAVCFWQAEKAVGGQHWTYFESVYFTYVAQLTIGYGDFEPQTNSAKPAFVFWALIALPTLTVLIGAVGDSVTETVNWFTIWLPQHAPALVKLSARLIRASGRTGGANEDEASEPHNKVDSVADAEKASQTSSDSTRNAFGQMTTEPIVDAFRPFLMVQTAQRVLEHIDEEKPRKYTYEEWTWLLKLLGEDEGTKEGHRRVGQPLQDGQEIATPILRNEDQVWSWIGRESPLMDLQDGSEPRWVLRRLLSVLQKDVKRRGDDAVDQTAGVEA